MDAFSHNRKGRSAAPEQEWASAATEALRAKSLIRRRLLRGGRLSLGILAAETLDAAGRIHQALLAGEERMACRADFHVNVALVGRAGLKVVSACAHHPHGGVIGMNLFLGHLCSEKPFLQSSLL